MNLLTIEDNGKNCFLQSKVPEITKTEPCMLGVDEAGRGPVLGPMVYGIAYCPISHLEQLKEIGCADSKTLKEEKREELFESIEKANDFCGWMLEVHSPVTISNSMYKRSKYNLNTLSQDSAAFLIQKALDAGINVSEVYVDTVGVAEHYQARLSEKFPSLKIKVTKQADALFPIVSAASICAKVTRDNVLKSWSFVEGDRFQGLQYGSGYPSDPVTKKFLMENIEPVFGYPQLVRFSWSTAEKILEDKAAEVQWDDDEESTRPKSPKKYRSVKSFFSKKPSELPKTPKKHVFFKNRCIKQASNF